MNDAAAEKAEKTDNRDSRNPAAGPKQPACQCRGAASLQSIDAPLRPNTTPPVSQEDGITGVILVGGKSRRMGQDKAFLEIAGRPLFEKVLNLFQECFSQVILVGDRAERFASYGLPCLPDLYPGSALGGLHAGLFHAKTQRIFVAPCDLPFPNRELLRHLCSLSAGCDAVVPQTDQGYEPLFALYGKSCLGPMRRLLESRNYRIFDAFAQLRVRYLAGEELHRLDREQKSFTNLNTREQFARAAGASELQTDRLQLQQCSSAFRPTAKGGADQ
jgi:molybdenum cofactor guanylyltransferase